MREMLARKKEAERVAAAERIRREEKERSNRLAAGVQLLEIPPQLNQVFTKLDGNNNTLSISMMRVPTNFFPFFFPSLCSFHILFPLPLSTGWQPPQSEKNVSKPNEIPIGGWKPIRLPADIDQFSFNKFTNIYFRAHVWGMKKDPIKTPFLPKSSESEFQESLAIFKLVLFHLFSFLFFSVKFFYYSKSVHP